MPNDSSHPTRDPDPADCADCGLPVYDPDEHYVTPRMVELLTEAGLPDVRGGAHHEGCCPVCAAPDNLMDQVLTEGTAP